ncbi:hypothetical protein AV274_1383 [Blastocystis sp. ATCC 50177/Nand II]|uniref:Leucine-rich repeat domain-containing protein n=2 Tax=Blastocystis sp. subtype 1 (strain ATCC 50177 / NandII) TaxID=478820 RepID=A0A196SM09_BLAHN|nr:hypothetical protein AV274_1383 [Blastocystis sp. ATCC 50177/Nand II]
MAEGLCTMEAYDSYLSLYPMKCTNDCDEYKTLHFDAFKKNCQDMLSKAVYTPYDMEYTILMDFSLDDLAGVMDVKQKYSGKGSYFDAVDTYQDAYESVFTTMDRDFCPADSNWIQYAKPNDCSLSWVTMIVNAGERALAMVGGNDRLSAEFVKQCYTQEDPCNGLQMSTIVSDLKDIGLVRESDADNAVASREDLCSIPQSKRLRFDVEKAEGPNRGALMNLIAEGNPVLTLLSMDMKQLRFVKDMREEDVALRATVYQPSLYGLVTGYVKTTEEIEGYWVVEGTPSPCENVNVKLPMRDNETNTDFAGIAGYAFALRFVGNRQFVVPSAGIASLADIPSYAQSIVFADDSFSEATEVDFSAFPALESLVFGQNTFQSATSLRLIGLKKLRKIEVGDESFPKATEFVLSGAEELEQVAIGKGCFVSSSLLMTDSSLQTLSIGDASFVDATTVDMENMPNLVSVDLGTNVFTFKDADNTQLILKNLTKLENTPSLAKVRLFYPFQKWTAWNVTNAGEMALRKTAIISTLEEWNALESITGTVIVNSDSMNDETITSLDFSHVPNLVEFKVGDACFRYVNETAFVGMPKLERLEFGEGSFAVETYAHKIAKYDNPQKNTTRAFYLKDCDNVEELVMGRYSFNDYYVCEIENVPSLELIKMGELDAGTGAAAGRYSWNFFWANSLVLRNLPKLTTITTEKNNNVASSYSFTNPYIINLEDMPNLTTITLDATNAFRFAKESIKKSYMSGIVINTKSTLSILSSHIDIGALADYF